MKLLDIGAYAADSRLVEHGERYATFYGHRCDPSVGVRASGSGFRAAQHRDELREGQWVLLEPTVTADGATAAEALAKIIGPVAPR